MSRKNAWPDENSAEYKASTESSWAPSWTAVGKGRDIGGLGMLLIFLAMVVLIAIARWS